MANRVNKKELKQLEDKLEKKREEILAFRSHLENSWKDLQEREVEAEEAAAKRQISLGLEKLDEQRQKEMEAIDMALHRMKTGDYGLCLSCGKDIPMGRLDAIPWTPFCTRCATGLQAAEKRNNPAAQGAPMIAHEEGVPDDELEAAIHEELREDGRVELEELSIRVRDGVVRVGGVLPSEASHEILTEVIQDNLGFHDVDDRVRIEAILWQRKDRETPQKTKKSEEEELFQGKDVNENVFHSRKSGKPISPPDEFIPERG